MPRSNGLAGKERRDVQPQTQGLRALPHGRPTVA